MDGAIRANPEYDAMRRQRDRRASDGYPSSWARRRFVMRRVISGYDSNRYEKRLRDQKNVWRDENAADHAEALRTMRCDARAAAAAAARRSRASRRRRKPAFNTLRRRLSRRRASSSLSPSDFASSSSSSSMTNFLRKVPDPRGHCRVD